MQRFVDRAVQDDEMIGRYPNGHARKVQAQLIFVRAERDAGPEGKREYLVPPTPTLGDSVP
jgi:hypothetical protein